jgi:uncharacterized membrane protein YgcG
MQNRNMNLVVSLIVSIFAIFFILPVISYGKITYPEPTTKFYVNDFANVLDEETENLIAQNGYALEEKTEVQLVLVTVNFTDGIPISEYTADLFNEWKLGSVEKNDGFLILLSIGDEDYWAVQGKGLEASLTSGEISQILFDYLEEDFDKENYNEGAAKIYMAFASRLGGNLINDRSLNDRGLNPEPIKGTADISPKTNFPIQTSVPTKVLKPIFLGISFLKIPSVFFFLFIILIFRRKRYYRRRFRIPFFPFGLPFINKRFWHGGGSNRSGTTRGSGAGRSTFSSNKTFVNRGGKGGFTRGGGAGRRK